jgi:anti-sigma regulatory factor (Ser/Thr protein kinase)
MRFPMHMDSVSRARQFVRSTLCQLDQDTIDTAELLTSELATNAIVHGHTSFDVIVSEAEGTLRVAVSDQSGRMPVLLAPGECDVHGRGLLILDRLARQWGTADDHPGKTVWFDLAAGAG